MAIKISVIIPVYNVQDYLPDCLDSLLEQTFCDYEMILVDDGSTDLSGKICQSYSKKYDKIKVIHKKNGGLSSARNAGIKVARGNYLAFVDSDDIVRKDYLMHMYMLSQSYQADLVCCDFCQGTCCKWTFTKQDTIRVLSGTAILETMYEEDVKKTVVWNKLYEKSLFTEHDIWFPVGKIYEDMYVMPQIFYYAKKMVITTQQLYFYRMRKGSIMCDSFSDRRMQVLDAIEFRMRYMKSIRNDALYQRELEGYVRKLFELFVKTRAKPYAFAHKKIQIKAKRIFQKKQNRMLSTKNAIKLWIMRCNLLGELHE